MSPLERATCAPEGDMSRIQGQHWQAAEVEFREGRFKHSLRPNGRAVLVSALLGWCGTVCPRAILEPQDRPAGQQPAAKIEIPFRFYNDNLVIVKATIGGVRNVNMILDTGTNPSSISKEVADKLKLPRKAESLETLNGTIRAESVVLPGLDVGPLHAGSLRVIVQDLRFMEESLGISLGGIIGLDVLSTGTFTIDYARRRIVFGLVPPELKIVPFAARAPFLTIRAKIDGQEVRLLVDSGTWGLVLYRNRLKMAPERAHLDRSASISTSGGATHLSWMRSSVSVGEESLGARDIAIANVDSDPGDGFDGLMGFARMGFHRVAFDFENGRFGWD
jgi:predicted aspartyl protease